MTSAGLDLEKLLSPLGCDAFFSAYWEKQHLLLRRDQPRYCERLLEISDMENMISNSDARYPAIRLARAGRYDSRSRSSRLSILSQSSPSGLHVR